MMLIHRKQELQDQLREWRLQGDHVALVPTMGNLHLGHQSLVEIARQHAERVVVTIFVNPMQFGANEDFDAYPRTLERDTRRLRKSAADILYAPELEAVYPFGLKQATLVTVPFLADKFCGTFRPGHFDGVTTVVARLFAIVQPDVAVFGQKDYQQQLVIRRMVEDLSLPIKIIAAPTVREDDGLALSSRNSYLDEEQRLVAPRLYEILCTVSEALQNGKRNFETLEEMALVSLAAAGFDPDYVAVRKAADLSLPEAATDEFVVLAAANLGAARLIDNIVVHV